MGSGAAPKYHYPLYLGGVAACITTLGTHPLDLVKVQLQSNPVKGSVINSLTSIYHAYGMRGFYQGISAGLLRQMTYSTARFGAYDAIKAKLNINSSKFISYIRYI
ncbi:hypothetical protein DSO57_1004290 [Entomophthora muscae]|uniref:Uncharacterized protein n=1 Tax=Entomophthora muscae TaxID=34485 RepID=A0ACC2TVW6_9FUNG|nr:hypothetical protein DSO57_1004290 [Entomophthora muscae]